MSVLNFLMGTSLASPLTQTKDSTKTKESTTTTTPTITNPFVSNKALGDAVQGAMGSAQQYYDSASKAKADMAPVLEDSKAKVAAGNSASADKKNAALQQAALQFQTAQAAASTNATVLNQYAETYGSTEFQATKRAAFEQAQRDRNQLLQAQADADTGSFMSQFAAGFTIPMYEAEVASSSTLVSNMQAEEINATNALQQSIASNTAVVGSANAYETAKAAMLAEQADAVLVSAKEGLELNRESWMATNQALGIDQQKSAAAYDKLNAAFKSNELTTSVVRAEQEKLQLEMSKYAFAKMKKDTDRSESMYQFHEANFKRYQESRGIPETEQVSYATAVDQQETSKLGNPLLMEYVNWSNYTKSEGQTAISKAFANYDSRVPQTADEAKRIQWAAQNLQAKRDQITTEYLTALGKKSAATMTEDEQRGLAVKLAPYMPGKDGKLQSTTLTDLDREYKEMVDLAAIDMAAGNKQGMTALPDADVMVNALGIRELMIGAGADPEVVDFIQSGKAQSINLSIPKDKPVKDALMESANVFVSTLKPEVLAQPANFPQVAQAAAKYYATAQAKLRTHKTVVDSFPNWTNNTAKGNKLLGESDINIESASSLQPIFMQALIKQHAKNQVPMMSLQGSQQLGALR